MEEAIEAFRQHIIEKELEIADIIESNGPFYRHFKLEYGDNLVLPIRCTYDAHFAENSLQISCYEYRELQSQRILSNGEIEKTDSLLEPAPEYIDARNVKQTYSITIFE